MRTSIMRCAAVALCLGIAAGCSDNEPDPPRQAGTDPPATTVSSAEQRAREQILTTYDGYLEAYVAASAEADYRTKELAEYVAEPLLGQLLNNLQNMSRSGVTNVGRPRWSPTVTELRLDADEAVIEDCFDGTNWKAVGGKAGPTPTSQPRRYPVVVKVKRVNDRWYVYESSADRTATC